MCSAFPGREPLPEGGSNNALISKNLASPTSRYVYISYTFCIYKLCIYIYNLFVLPVRRCDSPRGSTRIEGGFGWIWQRRFGLNLVLAPMSLPVGIFFLVAGSVMGLLPPVMFINVGSGPRSVCFLLPVRPKNGIASQNGCFTAENEGLISCSNEWCRCFYAFACLRGNLKF